MGGGGMGVADNSGMVAGLLQQGGPGQLVVGGDGGSGSPAAGVVGAL
jgi:hypothetical protein